MSTTLNLQVNNTANDGYAEITFEGFGTFSVYIGNFDGDHVDGWLLFTNVTVPQGATIDEALLTYKSDGSVSGTVTSQIYAHDTDDAASPTSISDWETKESNMTTANVSWSMESWTSGTDYESPDIKSIIQEIVDRVGWASGNDILIMHLSTENSSDIYKTPYDYEDNSAYAAKLNIEYTEKYDKTLTANMNMSGDIDYGPVVAKELTANMTMTPVNSRKFTTVSVSVIAANKDGREYDEGSFTNATIGVGMSGGKASNAWALFRYLVIPQGATITNAVITYTSKGNYSGTVHSKLFAQDTDDGNLIAAYSNWVTKHGTPTTAEVVWDIGAWTTDTEYDSPNLASIVQEIVDRGGWGGNNDILIFHDSTDSDDTIVKYPYDYGESAAKTARIAVTFTTDVIQNNKTIIGTMNMSPSAAIPRDINKNLSQTMNIVGSIEYSTGEQYDKTLTATMNMSPFVAIPRDINKNLSQTMNIVGSIANRSINKSLDVTYTMSPNIQYGTVFKKILSSIMNINGMTSRSTGKNVVALTNMSALISNRSNNKTFTALTNMSGNITKHTERTFVGLTNMSGSLIKAYGKELIAYMNMTGNFVSKDILKNLLYTMNLNGTNIKESIKSLVGNSTITAGSMTKMTGKVLSSTINLVGSIEKTGATITINNPGNAPTGLGSQEGSYFNITVTGTFSTFSITMNGKTLTYTDNIVADSINIYNTTAKVTDRTKLTGDTTEYLTMEPGDNIVLVTKIGGSVDFKFDYTPLYV